jgi:UDP-N-acetylglucosamine transferase subunit ALG13
VDRFCEEGEFVLVFVSVGNATQNFRRLLETVDRLAGENLFGDESVLLQVGNDPTFRALNCLQESFLPMEQFWQTVRQANLIICHGGAGMLLQVFQCGKTPVVMPRRRQFGEHIDDHQLELVKALAEEGRLIPAFSPIDLPEAIARARNCAAQAVVPRSSRMISLVAQAIESAEKFSPRTERKEPRESAE